MPIILVATPSGCRAFTEAGEGEVELPSHRFSALAPEAGGACLAVVDEQEVWRRAIGGGWSKVADAAIGLQSIAEVDGTIFCGGMDEAAIVRMPASGKPERLKSFDIVPGRDAWFAGGPPLGVRSLAGTADGAAILAAVHVGGIPRSEDGGESWTPTVPILFDVHEVRAHPSSPGVVAAAAAVGLCMSHNGGRSWDVHSDGLPLTNSLAVAVLHDEVLFGISDGPFAKESQLWRWRIGGKQVEQVRDGLPEWLEGKIDTAHIATGAGRAAVLDRGGNLWLSLAGSRSFERIGARLPYASGVLIL